MADEKVLITESTLDDIADAIREKNGEEFEYYPNEMPAAVRRIPTGGGGGGSTVAVFAILQEGTHIADIVVDGDSVALYAPTPIDYQEGTGIEISNGEISVSNTLISTINSKVGSDALATIVNNLTAAIATKQDMLTAGQGITITGTTISADGTDVEANPSEEPTEELNSIKIGDTVYEIIGGGGGSYSEEIIYTGTNSSSTPITLTKNINEFDLIQFVVSYTDHNTTSTYEIPVKYFVDNYPYSQFSSLATPNLTIALAGSEWFRIARGQTDTQLQFMKGNNFYLKNVIGIKTGGSGGGASAVSDLTDVDLTNLADGQVLKWNATTQKWENANESGGTTLPFDVVINSNDNGIDIVYDDGT